MLGLDWHSLEPLYHDNELFLSQMYLQPQRTDSMYSWQHHFLSTNELVILVMFFFLQCPDIVLSYRCPLSDHDLHRLCFDEIRLHRSRIVAFVIVLRGYFKFPNDLSREVFEWIDTYCMFPNNMANLDARTKIIRAWSFKRGFD